MWSETLPYRKYREQYVPKFFAAAAKELNLKKEDCLLDVACGTGTLALGFSPYVGAITGFDIEQPMIDAACAEANRRKITTKFLCAGIEEFPDDGGKFDLVTIGKAHWYLPQAETCRKLDALLTSSGRVLICWTTTHDRLSGRWAQVYRHVRNEGYRLNRSRITPIQFMADSTFTFLKNFHAIRRQPVTMKELLLRTLAFPGSTPDQLGSHKDKYIAKIRAAVEPFAINGRFEEVVSTFGAAFVRR